MLKKYIEYSPKMSYEEIILLGINYSNLTSKLSKKELIELKYYSLIIENLSEDTIIIKRFLSKDSTASIFQHLSKILGLKDNEHTKSLNLTDEFVWHDTYFVFLDAVIIATRDIPLNYVISREVLKKVIMTRYYSASYPTLWKTFRYNIRKKYGKEFLTKNYNELSDLFLVIYRTLPSVELKMYNSSVKEFLERIKNIAAHNDKSIIIEDISISLEYNKSISFRRDFMKNGVRRTIVYNVPVDIFYARKTYNALVPNIIHTLDAAYVRETLLEMNIYCIVIHDAFLIDFANADLLINTTKKTININKKFTLYCMYQNPNINNSTLKLKIKSNAIVI